MKKAFIFLLIFCCAVLAAQTYIPMSAYKAICETHSYYEAITASNAEDTYTVLCIKDGEVLSNLKFHDAFKLGQKEINFSFVQEESDGATLDILIDKNTDIKYIKISDSTDYYAAYDKFLTDNILAEAMKNAGTGAKNYLSGKEWNIDKDQWHYTKGIDIILYSRETRQYVGFSGGKLYTLQDGDALEKVIARNTPL
ncbi:MAG: hypothetical protein J5747_09220 [Spirochaetaceae bacterium]|nr:hypothetical protein [Spirochaetaceae bacterium]